MHKKKFSQQPRFYENEVDIDWNPKIGADWQKTPSARPGIDFGIN